MKKQVLVALALVSGVLLHAAEKEIAGEVTVTDANFDETFAGIDRVRLTTSSAKIIFDLDGDHRCASMITGSGSAVKCGTGTLTLGSRDGNAYNLAGGWTVSEGVLKGAEMSLSWLETKMDRVAVNDPGVLFLADVGRLLVADLSGDGVITNANGGTIVISGGSFAGRIMGNVSVISGGRFDLTGSASNYRGSGRIEGGSMGVAVIGMKDGIGSLPSDSYYSSRTFWADIFRFTGPGALRFINTEKDITDKSIAFANVDGDCTFDGGVCGGIDWQGEWYGYGASGSTNWRMHSVVLTGSNETACVMSGPIHETTDGATYITKRGPGVWKFADNANRKNTGTIAVEDGTLQFTSIAETNEVCSLGLATMTAERYTQLEWDESRRVPYAVLLGTPSTTGTISYVGTEAKRIRTRHFALSGHGRISSDGSAPLFLHGVFAATQGDSYLHLGGTNEQNNVIYGISNGVGRVSVVKDGPADWSLEGPRSFTGGIDVREGRLRLHDGRYSWFRFTVRKVYKVTDNYVQLNELALFDKDGCRQNLGLKTQDVSNDPFSLAPGSACYHHYPVYGALEWWDGSRPLAGLFDGGSMFMCVQRYGLTIGSTGEDSYLSFMMRLTNGAPAIATYDMGVATGYWPGSGAYTGSRDVGSWQLEASANGYDWKIVHESAPDQVPPYGGRWYATGDSFANDLKGPHADGFKFSSTNDVNYTQGEVAYVRVSPGAVLDCDSTLVSHGLAVDAVTGGGTLRNVTFADDTTLYVENIAKETSSAVLNMTYENVSGLENVADWPVSVNGRTGRYTASLKNGQITVTKTGALMIILK